MHTEPPLFCCANWPSSHLCKSLTTYLSPKPLLTSLQCRVGVNDINLVIDLKNHFFVLITAPEALLYRHVVKFSKEFLSGNIP